MRCKREQRAARRILREVDETRRRCETGKLVCAGRAWQELGKADFHATRAIRYGETIACSYATDEITNARAHLLALWGHITTPRRKR